MLFFRAEPSCCDGSSQNEGLTEFERDGEILWTQIQRLSTQARGLLNFSHKELKILSFDLNALCKEMVEVLQPQNAFDKVKLELELDPNLPEVDGDAGQIHQVILNICRNASDALGEAGVEEARVWIRSLIGQKGYVRIEIDDNGPGVPKAIKQRIFEPGFTTKDRTETASDWRRAPVSSRATKAGSGWRTGLAEGPGSS